MKGPPPGAKYFNVLAAQVAGRRHVPVFAVVRHVGRRSGKTFSTPVAVLTTPDAFIIGLPWGKSTDWVRNLQAAGGGTVQWQGRDEVVTDPQFVNRDVASAAAPALLRPALAHLPGDGTFLHLRRLG